MGFATETVKYILFFFNFLCALAGLLLLIIAVLANSEGGIKQILHSDLSTPSVILAIVGGLVFIIAFFGCCGAIKESHCMLIMYAVILLTLLVIEVGAAVLAFVYRNQVEDVVRKEMAKEFSNYTNNKEVVDKIQHEFQCCGANRPDEWNSTLPPSCCKDEPCSLVNAYKDGCSQKVIDESKYLLKKLGGVAIGVAFVKAIAVVFSLCLASSIKRHEMRGYG